MISVSVIKKSNYPVSSKKLQKRLAEFFVKNGIVSDAEVSIALVGEKMMLTLSKRYLEGDSSLHSVLSFASEESKGEFVYPPEENRLHLGDIVICYPVAFQEARAEDKLIEEKVTELAEHGALHLLGIHHE